MARTFQQLIQSDQPVLVDFTATWCGPCKMMAPILQELKSAMGDQLTIIKIDVDQNQAAAQYFQVQGVPTLILFRNGEVRWRQSGVMGAKELQQVIQQYAA